MSSTLTSDSVLFKAEDYKGPSHFVHLHNHSIYSTLDGVGTAEAYADRCKKWGFPAMSLTEHGHMASVPDAYMAFKKAGVKYIAGCEIYLNDYEPIRQQLAANDISMKALKEKDPDLAARIGRNRHLTILCKNETGFHNLVKLTTQAYETGFYYRPRIWFDKLLEYKEGLIILSGCLNGPVCHELRLEEPRFMSPDKRGAIDWVMKFKEAFGEDYYIELQMPGIEKDHEVFWRLIEIADHFKIKTVLANDVHYLRREDHRTQMLMMAIDQGMTIDSPDLFHVNSSEQYFKSRGELWATFKNNLYSAKIDDRKFEEMCDNSLLVADRCANFKIDLAPKQPKIRDAGQILAQKVAKALHTKGYDKDTKKYLIDGREVTYVEQAKIELDRFISKGFASYFLITQDLIDYGKSKGFPFYPRGSAGGSLVNHLLGISTINPMLWELSADRFLADSRGGYMLNVTMGQPIGKANAA